MDTRAGRRDAPPARLAMQGNAPPRERQHTMTIYEQMCRERYWIDHRTPVPVGQILPPRRTR